MTKHARNPILLLEDERATGALIVQLLAGARGRCGVAAGALRLGPLAAGRHP